MKESRAEGSVERRRAERSLLCRLACACTCVLLDASYLPLALLQSMHKQAKYRIRAGGQCSTPRQRQGLPSSGGSCAISAGRESLVCFARLSGIKSGVSLVEGDTILELRSPWRDVRDVKKC